MTLYEVIYEFFYTLVFNQRNEQGTLDNIWFEIGHFLDYSTDPVTIKSSYIDIESWLCHTATIISIVIIVVLCCLFVYKIIKLIGGLIR